MIIYRDLLIITYYLAFWLRYFTDIDLRVFLGLFSMFCLLTFIHFFKGKNEAAKRIYIKNLFVVLIACIGILVNNNHTLGDGILLCSWVSMGILLADSESRLNLINNFNRLTFLFLFVGTFFAFRNSTSDLDLFVSVRVGSNSISIIAIQCFFIDYICRKKNGKKISYLTLAVLMILSLMSRGVMNILSTVVLIVGVFLQEEVKTTKKLLRYVFMIAAVILIAAFSESNVNRVITFISQGDSSTRLYQWKHYVDLAKWSMKDIIFGLNNKLFISDPVNAHYRNLHNTFFNWHYFYGAIPPLYYLFIIIQDLKRGIVDKDPIVVVVIIVTILRGMTDETTYSFMLIWMFVNSYNIIKNYRERVVNGAKELSPCSMQQLNIKST